MTVTKSWPLASAVKSVFEEAASDVDVLHVDKHALIAGAGKINGRETRPPRDHIQASSQTPVMPGACVLSGIRGEVGPQSIAESEVDPDTTRNRDGSYIHSLYPITYAVSV